MFKGINVSIVSILFVTVLSVSMFGVQQSKPIAPAPTPTQIIAGKKAFVSNVMGERHEYNGISGMPDRPYNQFYAAMKSWGHYELMTLPAEADVIFEICFSNPLGTTKVLNGDGGSGTDPQINLRIIDPKTHVSLWWFTEHFVIKDRHSTRDIQFDDAMTDIVNDLKKLASPPAVPMAVK